MPEETPTSISPNDALAEKVAAALGAAGFIAPTRLEELTTKLKSGTIRDADWRLWIEEPVLAQEAQEKAALLSTTAPEEGAPDA